MKVFTCTGHWPVGVAAAENEGKAMDMLKEVLEKHMNLPQKTPLTVLNNGDY